MGIRLFHSAQFQPYYIDIDKDKGQSAGHVTATVLTVTIIRRYFIFIKLSQSIREHRRFDNRGFP